LDEVTWILAALALLGVLLAAFAAAAEMALASVSRLQLRQTLAAQKTRAQAVEALLGEPARFLSALLVIKVLGFVLASGSATFLVLRLGIEHWLVWWLLLCVVVLILSQLLPRAWVVGRQERIALRLAPIVQALAWVLTPVTALMRRIGRSAVPNGAVPESIFLSEDGLRFLLNVTEEETVIEDQEKEMIASVFQLGETLVREVMVPRIDVHAVPGDLPMLEAIDLILKAGHSRIPVYEDTIDNVIGILYAKDLLRYLRDGRIDVPLKKILRTAYFIPEAKKVDDLLRELQQRKVHMAVVVDEYGGTAGLVTIEDLLEEIVGEIQDEYDAEEPTVEALSEREYLFDARVNLGEVNERLGGELVSEGSDTLGGYIYGQLGKVPAVGDTVEVDNMKIEVLSVAGRRIKQVRVSRMLADGGAASTEKESEGTPRSDSQIGV
jgi:magnesium and cobalt exporter, CNNM family